MQPPRNPCVTRVVRRRITEFERGEREEARTVLCPLHRRSVELSFCQTCPHRELAEVPPDAEQIQCRPPVAAPRGASPRGPLELELDDVPVSELMSPHVTCVDPDLPLGDVARLLAGEALHGLPVVDEDGTLLGVVSQSDVVRGHGALDDEEEVGASPLGAVASDFMTAPAASVSESATLGEAVRLLAREHLHRLPVTDEAGRVVGLLSSADLLRWLAARSR